MNQALPKIQMPLKAFNFVLLLIVFSILLLNTAQAATLRVAVSANFSPTLRSLTLSFEKQTGHKIELISAATGTLFQQISYGAPFDVYMAADTQTPNKLVKNKLALTNSIEAYAYGKLALWSLNQKINSLDILNTYQGRLAIANPKIAPYGKAAKELLNSLKLWRNYNNRLITGTNINQTFQQARSGAVNIAIIANSQLIANGLNGYVIPNNLYSPIKQSMVILKRSKHIELAKQFTTFIMSPSIQQQIKKSGYQIHKDKQI